MGKRNIEDLFKEKFRDFEQAPNSQVWKSIEASLDGKKKKKRIIPFWWQLGGVAALLAILLYVINPFGTNEPIDSTIITATEEATKEISDDSRLEKNETPKDVSADKKSQFVNQNEAVVNTSESQTVDDKAESKNEDRLSNNLQEDNAKASQVDYAAVNEDEVVIENTVISNNDIAQHPEVTNESSEVAVVEQQGQPSKINQESRQSENTQEKNPIFAEETAVAATTQNEAKHSETNERSKIAGAAGDSKDEEGIANLEEEVATPEKKSIFDEIKDSKEEQEAVAAKSQGKWSVGPSVAPIYFNTLGEGSSIHSDYTSNSKSGNVNLSYGLTMSYDIGKRLKVRSGIHRVNFGYNTDDVRFSSSLDASSENRIENIDFNQNSRNLSVQSSAIERANFDSSDNNTSGLVSRTPEFEGQMVQELGYLELPIELNYALIDNRFGVNLIGGISSMFLVNNEISLESEGLVTEIGEANNANNINFSTNIGLGFNYEFSEKILLNVEPVFKYQLNTFSNTAGDFRPFAIGVYSGVSFRF